MVKEGYKQTEAGLIPEDWDTITFTDCFDVLPSNTLSRAELNYNGGKVKNIHYGDVLIKFPSVLDCSKEMLPYVNPECVSKCSTMVLQDGDVIIADTAEDNTVGKATEVIGIGEQRIVSGLHTIPCRPKQKDRFADKWLGYFINHSVYHDQILPFITGIKVSSISKGAIADTVIAVPEKSEQERIVAVLSDMDELIFSLEKLIAKKKNIREGAMQELLTGKHRLSGFDGEWVEKRVDEIVCRFATGLNPRQNFKLNAGGINYYVTIKDFRDGKLYLDDACDCIDDEALGLINNRSDLQKDDLLFSSIGRIGDAYLITETPRNWNINESVFTLRPNKRVVCPRMLYFLLTGEDTKKKLVDSTTGSTLKSMKMGHLKEITCVFPETIEEQEAISDILFEMSYELDALQSKLEKYRQMKSGMMDELLTGKVRLV